MKTLSILIISALIGVAMSILIQFPFVSSDSGSLIGFDARSPDLSNMSLVLYDKFDQVSPNSTKDLYLEFFDEKNKTLVKNVSFFVNATKDDTILMHELFYTHTGSMTLKFSPGSNTGKWIINGTAEPTLGGMMSDNDILPIEMSAFTPGTYHFHIEVLALVYTNGIADQTNPPTFDSWWSVDDKGNISKDANSTTISKIKNASPLHQFNSGIKIQDIRCQPTLTLVIKLENNHPACVTPQTAFKLVERDWGLVDNSTTKTMKIDNTKFSANYTITNAKILDIKMDSQSLSLIVTMKANGDGNLIVQVPRDLLKNSESNLHYGGVIVLNDGQESSYKEINSTYDTMKLLIPFVNTTKQIEIIGTYY